MVLESGRAYVYVTFGIHIILNASAGGAGEGAAVLIRAAEPLEGIPAMKLLRGVENIRNLARGPGNLARAFAIHMGMNGDDLTKPGQLWIARSNEGSVTTASSLRIGISKNEDAPWRFYVAGSPWVSGFRQGLKGG